MIWIKNKRITFDFQRLYFAMAIYSGIIGLANNDGFLILAGLLLIVLNGFRVYSWSD